MSQRKSTNDRIHYSLGTEQETNQPINENLTPEVQLTGGVYRATQPTYSDGDNAILHFSQDGELLSQDKTYSSISNANQIEEIDPLSQHNTSETLVDVTNGADDTYYYYVDMDNYRKSGYQLILDGGSGTVTVTVEGTLQDDGTAQDSCSYEDISSDTFGSANWTNDAMLIDYDEKLACYKYVRIKVVASTSDSDDADWTVYHKRLY